MGKRWLTITLVFAAGIAVGVAVVMAMRPSGNTNANMQVSSATGPTTTGAKQLYTCGMHPQVIQDHPGTCPICHMRLTPLKSDADENTSATGGSDPKKQLWWDPMLGPSSISEKPGKSAMGMDMVPYKPAESAGP